MLPNSDNPVVLEKFKKLCQLREERRKAAKRFKPERTKTKRTPKGAGRNNDDVMGKFKKSI